MGRILAVRGVLRTKCKKKMMLEFQRVARTMDDVLFNDGEQRTKRCLNFRGATTMEDAFYLLRESQRCLFFFFTMVWKPSQQGIIPQRAHIYSTVKTCATTKLV